MPCSEGIILALLGMREACQPPPLTQRMEVLSTSREDLMYISLMPYIPYDPIIRGIEDIVHRHGDLHCTEISS